MNNTQKFRPEFHFGIILNICFFMIFSMAVQAQSTPAGKVYSDHALLEAEKPVVAIEAVKMNVFYIGVDNPLRVAAAGIPANELQVDLVGSGTITGGAGQYNVQVTQPGEITVRVSRKTGTEVKLITNQKYRVKRIPDPAPRLEGKYRSGSISKKQLSEVKSVVALMENFDFDAACNVVGFVVTILPKEQDPVTFTNTGATLNTAIQEKLGKLLGDGDTVFFEDIKIRCPGDAASRHIGGMSFKVGTGIE